MNWTGPQYAEQLFQLMARCGRADFVISGYPEYGTDPHKLTPAQRSELTRAATVILSSLSALTPVRAFLVVGHADKALRKAPHERAAFEQEVSQKRADAAEAALLHELIQLAGGPAIQYIVYHDAIGIGNLRPVVAHAATEEQMRKNRRIEIMLARLAPGRPRCGV
jgi:outer membrane protein OmpA-like peptidoglycan-associated protein